MNQPPRPSRCAARPNPNAAALVELQQALTRCANCDGIVESLTSIRASVAQLTEMQRHEDAAVILAKSLAAYRPHGTEPHVG